MCDLILAVDDIPDVWSVEAASEEDRIFEAELFDHPALDGDVVV